MKTEFNLPHDVVYVNCLEIAKQLDFKIKKESMTEGLITYKVGMSMLSWGETFVIRVAQMDEKRTSVEVGSFHHQLYDWGKSDDNISTFVQTLKERLIR